jgi:hypothetical protein
MEPGHSFAADSLLVLYADLTSYGVSFLQSSRELFLLVI